MSVFTLTAFGQDKEADVAKALLEKGVAQYKALDFRQAKATLLKVNAQMLSDQGKKTLNEHLGKVDTGIRGQAAAKEALASAQEALKANKLTKAKQLFAKAAASQYLSPANRSTASRQVALITRKQQAVALAAKAQPKVPAVLAAAAVPTPRAPRAEDKPKATPTQPVTRPTKPVTRPKDAVQRMLDAVAARQVKARELLAAGKAALSAEPAKAAELFRKALELVPDLAEAKKQLKFAEGLLGSDKEPAAVTRLEQRRLIARKRADLEIDKALGNSNEILARAKKPEDFQASANAAQVAMDILATNKELYTPKGYRDKRALIENQLKFAAMKQAEWERKLARDQMEEKRRMEHERIARQQQQKQLKIATLTGRAKASMAGRRFEQALQEVERVLSLDPKNRWAAEQKETLAQFIILMSEKDAVKTRNVQTQHVLVDLKRSEIPWWKELTYPRDWRDITSRRTKYEVTAGLETEQDRRVRMRLKETIRELNFDDIELKDVIQFLRDVSGVNIYVKWSALAAAGITKATTVNVHLQEVTLEKALRVILEDVGAAAPLGYVVDSGVISISTKDDLATKTTTRVYDIRDLIVRIPEFIGPRLDLRRQGELGDEQGLDGDLDRGDVRLGGADDRDGVRREEEITKEEMITNIVDLFKATIAPDSWQNVNEVGITEMHGQLVITQTAANHEKIVDLLGQLREARAIVISIETRFISVQSGFMEKIGFEFDVVLNPTIPSDFPHAHENFKHFSGAGGTNPLTLGSATGAAHNLGDLVNWAHTVGGSAIGMDIGVATTPTALNISGAFLDDIQVNFLIQATQAHGLSRILTAPRVTLFNGQRAYVAVTRQQTYVSEFELTTSPVEGADAVRQEVNIDTEVMSTGTMLDVEATISGDRRYVTLTLRPQVSTGDLTQFVITGGDPENGTEFETTMSLPDITVSEVETSVSVPDGGTLLLGGLKRAAETDREIGVPLLSKVPILNRLFSNRGLARDDETLLILVTPKIIIQREQEELNFP
ncbi:MAG: hypothetical protein ISS78_06425 [Phycisphaerae bacterium]|nr:hypothetical protein [Phycisphaerae bacterium]